MSSDLSLCYWYMFLFTVFDVLQAGTSLFFRISIKSSLNVFWQNCTYISDFTRAWYISHPHHPWFTHSDSIQWCVQIMKLHVISFSFIFPLLSPMIEIFSAFWSELCTVCEVGDAFHVHIKQKVSWTFHSGTRIHEYRNDAQCSGFLWHMKEKDFPIHILIVNTE
jgi:hypothetical protein